MTSIIIILGLAQQGYVRGWDNLQKIIEIDMQRNDPGRQKKLWNDNLQTSLGLQKLKKSWATFCRRLIHSKNCQVLQECSRTIIFNFCNKTTQSNKKMIQNNLQIMIVAMLNGMMIFDFIVQFILFYCQYLHIRPCFHNVTTMRFKHSILFSWKLNISSKVQKSIETTFMTILYRVF